MQEACRPAIPEQLQLGLTQGFRPVPAGAKFFVEPVHERQLSSISDLPERRDERLHARDGGGERLMTRVAGSSPANWQLGAE